MTVRTICVYHNEFCIKDTMDFEFWTEGLFVQTKECSNWIVTTCIWLFISATWGNHGTVNDTVNVVKWSWMYFISGMMEWRSRTLPRAGETDWRSMLWSIDTGNLLLWNNGVLYFTPFGWKILFGNLCFLCVIKYAHVCMRLYIHNNNNSNYGNNNINVFNLHSLTFLLPFLSD